MVAITATAAITTATRYLDSHLQEVISETPFQAKTLTGLCLHVQMKVTTKFSLVIHTYVMAGEKLRNIVH